MKRYLPLIGILIMKKITILLYITLVCCLFACERDIPESKACPFETKDYLSEVCLIEKITPTVAKLGKAIYIGELDVCEYKVVSQSGEQLLTFQTEELGHMTINDCYPQGQDLPAVVPPDIDDPKDCAKY